MALNLIIGWQAFETKFQGQKVTMEVRPFKRRSMMAILPYLSKRMPDIKDEMTEEEVGNLADAGFELQGLAADLLPDSVRNISGITINASPITSDDLAEEPIFLPLVLEIISKIASMSTLNQAEAKNSGGLPGSTVEQAETRA